MSGVLVVQHEGCESTHRVLVDVHLDEDDLGVLLLLTELLEER